MVVCVIVVHCSSPVSVLRDFAARLRIAAYHDYHEHGEKTGDAELALRATAAIAAADMVLRFRGVEYKLVDKRDSTNP